MFEFFLNPWFMVAGGALVAAPIIIHLINRMRFKRIRWAAMEFLLKSQKRNRRRLIIEQLILLALRCFLVLLVGFLVSRFIGMSLAFLKKQSTVHVVVIDNTLSMADRWKDKGITPTNAFDEAKKLLKEKIARNVAQASSLQHLKVFLLSDLEKPIFDERLNEDSRKKLDKELDDKAKEPSFRHIPPIKAVQKAREVFAEKTYEGGDHVFHFLSDFRERDWKGEDAKELQNELGGLAAKAKVYLIDTSDPNRGDSRQVLVHHENIGIADLRPQVLVVPENEPIKLTVTVNNFTNKKFENVMLTVKVNNVQRYEASQPLANVPPGFSTHRFQLGFNEPGFNLISATLDDPGELADVGIKPDNERFAVVEVRKSVDILVIDGDNMPPNKEASRAVDGSGTFFLEKALSTTRGYHVVPGRLDDLLKPNLAQAYPCVYLLNPKFLDIETTKPLVASLERYVRDGGGLCVFLGDFASVQVLNTLFYREGEGLLPAPLADRPHEDKVAPDEIFARLARNEPSLLIRDEAEAHAIVASVYEEDRDKLVTRFFPFLNVEKYYPVARTKWRKDAKVEEIFTLPNRRSLDNYKTEALALVREIPVNDERFKDHSASLKRHQDGLMAGLTRNYKHLSELANAVYALLHDQGHTADPNKPGDVSRPNLEEFWQKKDVEDLYRRLKDFQDTVRYGDPLLLGKRYGQGRVIQCMTTAGTLGKWNDWPDGLAAPSYVVFMPAIRKYLASLTGTPSIDVGAPLTLTLDNTAYEGKMDAFQVPEVSRANLLDGSEDEDAKDKKLMDFKVHQEVPPRDNQVTFNFTGADKPGLYLVKLFPKEQEGNAKPPTERRAFVFNVDTNVEGDLRRASADVLAREASGAGDQGKVYLLHPLSDFSVLSNRQNDLSESPWLYVLLLIVLVVEQALAVHLSFHTKGGPVAAPAATVTTTTTA